MQTWYRNVAALDRSQHSHLKLRAEPDLGFVAHEVVLPLALEEMEMAARAYPIVFSRGKTPMPLAVVGVRKGENLFVTPAGKWRQGGYIPAAVRNYPFVVIEAGEGREIVGVDTGSGLVGEHETGAALFDGEALSEVGRERLRLCGAFREAMKRTQAFGAALREAGVLEVQQARIELPGAGERLHLDGFDAIKTGFLDSLSDPTLLEWRERGWLQGAMQHLTSVGQWRHLLSLADHKTAEPAPHAGADEAAGPGHDHVHERDGAVKVEA
jgi:hypothetical protein